MGARRGRGGRCTAGLLTAALLLGACGSGDDGDGATAAADDGTITIWVPAAMRIGDFLRDEVGGSLDGIEVTVDEAEGRLEDWEGAVRSGVDADLVALPVGMGRDLLLEGVLGGPSTVLWDADVYADEVLVLSEVNLGVMLAAPTPGGTALPALSLPTLLPVEWSEGCWVDAPAVAAASGAVGATAVVAAQAEGSDAEAVVTTGKSNADKAVDAATNFAIEFGIKQAIVRLVAGSELELYTRYGPGLLGRILLRTGSGEALAQALGSQAAANAGLKVASSAVGRVNVVVSTALTMKDLYEYYKANYEADKARFDAIDSGIEVFYDIMARFGDHRLEAASLLTGLASCDLSVEDARAELERLRTRISGLTNAAAEALVGVSEQFGAPSVDQMIESWDNRQRLFDQTANQVFEAIQAKEASAAGDDDANTALRLADQVREDQAAAAAAAEQLIDRESWEAFANLLAGADQGNTWTHSDGQQTATSMGVTDIIGQGSYWLDVSADSADLLFGDDGPFGCGQQSMGWVVCGGIGGVPSAGTWLVLTTILDDPLPMDGLDRHYQYGFVLDLDGDAANNYRAGSSFPADTFDDTDTWFQVLGDPGGTFRLEYNSAEHGFQAMPTDARVLLYDNSMTLVVPTLEGEVSDPTWRGTAFWHDGNYGVNGAPFNGDAHPAVDQPQLSILDELLTANDVLLP